jgi:tetratricopeptide (TPR) repeat protein
VRLLLAVAGRLSNSGRAGEALGVANEALAVAVAHEDVAGKAHAHHYAATALRTSGDHSSAEEREALALRGFEEIGDLRTQAIAINGIALSASARGDINRAIDANGKAAALFEQIGAMQLVAVIDNNLGYVLYQAGRYEEASTRLERALLALGTSRSQFGALAAANNVLVRVAQGRIDEAAALLPDAAPLTGGPHERTLWVAAASVRLAEGDIAGSTDALAALDRCAPDAETVPTALRLRGLAELAQGHLAAGIAALEASLAAARASDLAIEEAHTLDALFRVTGDAAWRVLLDDVVARVGIVAIPPIPPGAMTGVVGE